MNSTYIENYFNLVEKQRVIFYQSVSKSNFGLWKRPLPDKWSVGETLYHVYLMVRLVRRFSTIYLPLAKPLARIRKHHPYQTSIHNIYVEYTQKKKGPMKAPYVLTPPKNLNQTYTLLDIQQLLINETNKFKNLVAELEEPVAGHIRYPDPVAHYPNVIQSVHLLAIHEQHHFSLTEGYIQARQQITK
ncbi:DinB family protein [Ornithinibacillus sp. JPR2-1]|uniref:DinB family protein n=1 Tax=Ornithinibacillus sp. JPR2-1 TaxID=2094019 RepID=UPI0031DF41EC